MALKILGGTAKGKSLVVPRGDRIRPTSVMLRRKVFDSFQNLADIHFIDACAGSGAMGLEAWSRGADSVHLNEANRQVFRLTQRNYESVGSPHEITLTQQKIESWILSFKRDYQTWGGPAKQKTIFFFDPPYTLHRLYEKIVLDYLVEEGWFEGVLWLESDQKKGLPTSFWTKHGLKPEKEFTQGDSYLWVLSFSQ